ncbi:unnamed protein product, partial [Ixodes hexagonus]
PDGTTVLTALVSASLFVAAALWIQRSRKPEKASSSLPPGPWGLPLLGYLPFLRRKQHVVFRDLAHKYGPVFSVRLGPVDAVILNNYESVREGFSKKQLLARTSQIFLEQAGVSGVMNLNGKHWIENRKYCVHAMSCSAYGKKDMEGQVQAEIEYLVKEISAADGSSISVVRYLLPSVSNNVAALVFGQRYDFQDPKRKKLDDILDTSMRCLAAGAMITFTPKGFKALATMCFTRLGALKQLVGELKKFICEEQGLDENVPREPRENNFIDGYLQLISEGKEDPNTSFNSKNL